MKYTKNYRLPQWVESDRIMMNDFNSAMTNIESGIDGAKAEAKASADTLAAKDQELEGRIAAADAKASAAQTAANMKPYVTGSYFAQGATLTINLGFRPSFLIVTGMKPSDTSVGTGGYERYFAITGGNTMTGRVDFTDTGFTVHAIGATIFPNLCLAGQLYEYIAFK